MADEQTIDLIVKSLERVHDKQDTILDEQKKMTEVLARNTESLITHMYRTELLEKAVANHNARISPLEEEALRQKAVKTARMERLKSIAGVLGAISAIVGIGVGILKAWKGF